MAVLALSALAGGCTGQPPAQEMGPLVVLFPRIADLGVVNADVTLVQGELNFILATGDIAEVVHSSTSEVMGGRVLWTSAPSFTMEYTNNLPTEATGTYQLTPTMGHNQGEIAFRVEGGYHGILVGVVRLFVGETGCPSDEDCDGRTPADGDCNDLNPWQTPDLEGWDGYSDCDGVDDDCDGVADDDWCR